MSPVEELVGIVRGVSWWEVEPQGTLELSSGGQVTVVGRWLPSLPLPVRVRGEYDETGRLRVLGYSLVEEGLVEELSKLRPDLPRPAVRWLARQITRPAGLRRGKAPGLSEEESRRALARLEVAIDRGGALSELVGLGLSEESASRLYGELGREAVHLVRADPYLLAALAEPEVPFAELDRVAARMGLSWDAGVRLRGAVRAAVTETCFGAGHSGISRERLADRAAWLLRRGEAWGLDVVPVRREAVEQAIDEASVNLGMLERNGISPETRRILRRSGDYVYSSNRKVIWPAAIFWSENQIAERIDALLRAGEKLSVPCPDPGLNPEQRAAVEAFWQHPVLVITGGPGTGKTYVIRALLASIHEHRPEWTVRLAAPMGKAAQRLRDVTGDTTATTVHDMLRMTPRTTTPYYWLKRPMDADVVVVDEASTMDVFLLRDLLWSVQDGTRVVLVGDPDQLQAVGPGAVLQDLIDAGVPTVRLVRGMRTGPGSGIRAAAEALLEGRVEADGRDVRLAGTDELWKLNLANVQVLTAYRWERGKHAYAIEVLNPELQARLNPGTGEFRQGDRVVQTRSIRRDDGSWIRNGELGVVTDVQVEDGSLVSVTVRYATGAEHTYSGLEIFRHLDLAYALTVHKSQGSEFDEVAVLVGRGGRFWTRQLLYTALTRAKQRVWLLGEEEAMQNIAQNEAARRRTRLSRLIAKKLSLQPVGA